MASPIKGEWFKALICLLTIGSAYWYRDQAAAVTLAAFAGLLLGEQSMRIRQRVQIAEDRAPSAMQRPQLTTWQRRNSEPMDEQRRTQFTVLLFCSILGIIASRSAIYDDSARWWGLAAITLFIATGAYSFFLLSRVFWKPKS